MNPNSIKEKKLSKKILSNNKNKNSLENIKNKIIELVSSFLLHKFSKFFNEKNYSEKKLKDDVRNIITEKKLETLKLEDTIAVIEKNILEKLKVNSIEYENLLGNLKTSQISQEEKSKSPVKSNLLKKLHQKANDEWSQTVKNQYELYRQEQKEKFEKKNHQKQSTKEFYEMQISEKDAKKNLELQETEKFVKIRDENLKNMEETEKKIVSEEKEKLISQKEIKIKMYNDFHSVKKSQKLKEEMEEKIDVDWIINKKKEDEDKKLKKKEVVKDLYKKVYEQIENKIDRIQERKEKEKLENMKKSEEYSKILQQRDNERNKTIYKVLKKFEKKYESEQSPNFKFIDRDEIKNSIGEDRYREQSIEKEIAYADIF